MVAQRLSPEGRALRCACGAALVASALMGPATGHAFEFKSSDGEWQGAWDNTLSYGQAWRIRSPNLALIGIANGGTGQSVNFDDGNLNYHAGDSFSKALKWLSEFSLKHDNHFGVFARVSALYDFAVMDDLTQRTPISENAKVVAGRYVRLLDAFGWAKWTLGADHDLQIRIGKQVINWGESTFISSPFTDVNALDVTALRTPGAELKEAFLPQAMAQFSLSTSKNTSIEGFYQLQWIQTNPEPAGTYFSTNDFVTRGGNRVWLGFGLLSDMGTNFAALNGPYLPTFQSIPRMPDQDPRKWGQYGAAFRWFMPDFSGGTELGLMFVNYHSHLPLVSGRTGTQAGLGNAAGAATAVAGAARALANGLPPNVAIGAAAQAAVQASAAAGGNLSLQTATEYATIGANTALQGGNQAAIAAQANNMAQNEFGATSGYYVQYPENVHALGLTFNTSVGTTGVALQGELSYAFDVPLQFDDVEVLFAGLTPLEQALFGLANPGVPFPSTCNAQIPTVTRCGQLGSYGVDANVQGWGRYGQWQYQMTATSTLPHILGASQIVAVAEAGVTYVPNLPNKTSGGPNGQGLRFESTGTFISGDANLAGLQAGKVQPQSDFPSSTSWGYRLLMRADYENLVGPWNVAPRVFWAQDVKGITPGPGGNFLEGRTALTLGVSGTLRNTYEVDFSWTHFAGAGNLNLLGDRDFIAASLKVSF
jgi:hypothetical protein